MENLNMIALVLSLAMIQIVFEIGSFLQLSSWFAKTCGLQHLRCCTSLWPKQHYINWFVGQQSSEDQFCVILWGSWHQCGWRVAGVAFSIANPQNRRVSLWPQLESQEIMVVQWNRWVVKLAKSTFGSLFETYIYYFIFVYCFYSYLNCYFYFVYDYYYYYVPF